MMKKPIENAMVDRSGNETAVEFFAPALSGHGSFRKTDIFEATHAKVNGRVLPILSKWGVGVEDRWLRRPSEGGFGVVVSDGGGEREVTMWDVDGYLVDDDRAGA